MEDLILHFLRLGLSEDLIRHILTEVYNDTSIKLLAQFRATDTSPFYDRMEEFEPYVRFHNIYLRSITLSISNFIELKDYLFAEHSRILKLEGDIRWKLMGYTADNHDIFSISREIAWVNDKVHALHIKEETFKQSVTEFIDYYDKNKPNGEDKSYISFAQALGFNFIMNPRTEMGTINVINPARTLFRLFLFGIFTMSFVAARQNVQIPELPEVLD